MDMPHHHEHNRSDWYTVLGVEPSATFFEIRAAYRRSALALHSERLHSAADTRTLARAYDRLNAFSDAYRVLRNPEMRRAYDLTREARSASTLWPAPVVQLAQPRYATRARKPAKPEKDHRRLGRIAVVIGFGLLVLGAVAINIAERRQFEASMISESPNLATTPALEP